jgi:AcrR family transcriptional regulator
VSRLAREDWLDAGLALLAEGAEADQKSITIERLCERLERTKGSFYHHFEDIAAYQVALLERWQSRHTEALIEDSRAAGEGQARGERLRSRVASADLRIERAIRSWAELDAAARAAVKQVDKRRLAYLTELARARFPDPAKATIAARIEYAMFVGSVALFGDQTVASRELLSTSLDEALGLWAAASAKTR